MLYFAADPANSSFTASTNLLVEHKNNNNETVTRQTFRNNRKQSFFFSIIIIVRPRLCFLEPRTFSPRSNFSRFLPPVVVGVSTKV